MVDPPVKFKTIKGHTLAADADFGKLGAHLCVEPVPVHAEVTGGIAEAEKPRGDVGLSLHARIVINGQDKLLSRLLVHDPVRG